MSSLRRAAVSAIAMVWAGQACAADIPVYTFYAAGVGSTYNEGTGVFDNYYNASVSFTFPNDASLGVVGTTPSSTTYRYFTFFGEAPATPSLTVSTGGIALKAVASGGHVPTTVAFDMNALFANGSASQLTLQPGTYGLSGTLSYSRDTGGGSTAFHDRFLGDLRFVTVTLEDAAKYANRTGSIDFGRTAAVVPEPSVLVLMMLGFGMSGYALRRRRRPVAYA